MAEAMHVGHPFSPVYDERSHILILGSLPSVLSRENEFYYGNPRNRFWAVLSRLTGCPVPEENVGRRRFLLDHGIALWDVIRECDIVGSSDSSVRGVVPNDIASLLRASPVQAVFGNGALACTLYRRFCLSETAMPIVPLPSTSPANASYSPDKLCEAWSVILPYLIL